MYRGSGVVTMDKDKQERVEIRHVAGTVEIREAEDGEGRKLVGMAPPWDTPSAEDALPGFREVIERGAFSNLGDDIIATVEHDNRSILGRTSAGTLSLRDTEAGLVYEVDLPDTTAARDLAASVARGDISQSSFEFIVKRGGDRWVEEGESVTRTVRRDGALLRQVGPVARAAYPDAAPVALRSLEAWRQETAQERGARVAARNRNRLALAEADVSL